MFSTSPERQTLRQQLRYHLGLLSRRCTAFHYIQRSGMELPLLNAVTAATLLPSSDTAEGLTIDYLLRLLKQLVRELLKDEPALTNNRIWSALQDAQRDLPQIEAEWLCIATLTYKIDHAADIGRWFISRDGEVIDVVSSPEGLLAKIKALLAGIEGTASA